MTQQDAIVELTRLNLACAEAPKGHARRGQHPRQTGGVRAVFRIRPDIPEDLRIGLFAQACDYRALLRFSNGRSDDDRQADAHGLAIKLLEVPGRKLASGREGEGAHDFVLVDSETFFTGAVDEYLAINRGLIGRAPITTLLFLLRLLFTNRPLLRRILAFTSHRPGSPLDGPYFSTTPYAFGDRAVKYVVRNQGLRPSPAVRGRTGLAERLKRQLADETVTFDFGIDLQADPEGQPIEDPTRPWSAHPRARRVWLATVVMPRQRTEDSAALVESLAYSPWHALEAHRPLGFINQARAPVYLQLGGRRQAANGLPAPGTSDLPAGVARP